MPLSLGAASGQSLQRSVAILEVPEDDGTPDPIKTYGAQYLAETAGLPHTVTANVDSAAQHAFVLATAGFDATTLTPSQRDTLRAYVQGGGVLLAGNMKDPALFDLFGISGEDYSRQRHRLQFQKSALPATVGWMDELREQTISLGDPDRPEVALSRSYTPAGATVLGRFEDGTAAVTQHAVGQGTAYLLGVSLRDMTIRNQLNRDFTAQRSFSNGFEPTGDVFPLLLRSLYRAHVPHAVWKHTAPSTHRSALMITHDVDSESAMVWMNRFADYEQAQGLTATYYVTTHYIDDYLAGDFYSPYRDSIAQLDDQGQRIASHSVGHFPDFDSLSIGTLGNTRASYTPRYNGDETVDGTVLGELEVSQALLEDDVPQEIVSFRAGYLRYPDPLINGLDTLDYQFNSTFSANTVMTSFPYRGLKNRSFSGPLTDVWEIPMTISDVFADDPITEANYPEKVQVWLDVTDKYAANGAPVVLLIHPNRGFKLNALQDFVAQLPSDIAILSTEAFGQFWKTRRGTELTTTRTGDHLTIRLPTRTTLPDSLSLVVNEGDATGSITLRNKNGHSLAYRTTPRPDGGLFLHSATPTGEPPLAEASSVVESDSLVDFGATGVDLRFMGTDGRARVAVQKYGRGPADTSSIPARSVSAYRYVGTSGTALQYDSVAVRLAVSTLDGVSTPDDVQIFRRAPEGTGPFTALETTVGTNGTPDEVSDDTLYATASALGEIVLASDSNPLPVELAGFSAQRQAGAVRLTWTTTAETNNAGFEVQRRPAGTTTWTRIGYVPSTADGGAASGPIAYRFTDEALPFTADRLHYRLRQVDTDGSAQTFAPIAVEQPTRALTLQAPAPNPVRDHATLRFAVPERQRVTLRLYNTLGQRVRTLVDGRRSGRHTLRLQTGTLASGVYFLRLRAGDTIRTRRLTIVQ